MNEHAAVNSTVCLPIFRRSTIFKQEDFYQIQSYILQQKVFRDIEQGWVSTPDSSREAINPQIDISKMFIKDPANPIEKRNAEKWKNTCIIQGFVTEVVFDEKTKEPSRILISMPYVKNTLDEEFKKLDSHIWIYTNRLYEESQPVFIGSFIKIACVTNEYVKKNTGLNSKGIRHWCLLESDFLYIARRKNTNVLKKYPCSKVKTARCCIFQPNKNKPGFSKKRWASEYDELLQKQLFWRILSQGQSFDKVPLDNCQNL